MLQKGCAVCDTAWPACLQEHVLPLVQQALKIAGVTPADLTCIAYTKVSLRSGAQRLPPACQS